MANSWAEIQNLHLQSLGENTSGKIWISSLIRKMWDIAWDFCNFRNHTLHATEGLIKLEILDIINKRVTCHLKKGFIGLLTQCHFLFHTPIHTLITRPIRKRLSWTEAASSARRCFFPHPSRRRLIDTDKLLLGRITMVRLIPYLVDVVDLFSSKIRSRLSYTQL